MYFLLTAIVLGEVPKKLPPPKERGENLYKELCWQCHGEQGKGDGPLTQHLGQKPKDISGNDIKDEKAYIDIIQVGKGKMPGFEQVIDRHDSRRILLWLRDPVPQKKDKSKTPDKKSDKKDKQ